MPKNLLRGIPLKLLVIHIITLAVYCLTWGNILYCSYKSGYDAVQNKSCFTNIARMLSISLPVILVCTIIYLVIVIREKIKSFLPLLFLFVLSFIIIGLVTAIIPSSPAKGYYDYVKENMDINEIHEWLVGYEFNKYDEPQYGNVFEDNWPECIKKLNPRNVKIYNIDSVRYVKIIYFFGPSAAFGLCVMEEPVSVPPYDSDYSDTRIELSNNAFVWMN